jgi:hypothetical protein
MGDLLMSRSGWGVALGRRGREWRVANWSSMKKLVAPESRRAKVLTGLPGKMRQDYVVLLVHWAPLLPFKALQVTWTRVLHLHQSLQKICGCGKGGLWCLVVQALATCLGFLQ